MNKKLLYNGNNKDIKLARVLLIKNTKISKCTKNINK